MSKVESEQTQGKLDSDKSWWGARPGTLMDAVIEGARKREAAERAQEKERSQANNKGGTNEINHH